MSIYQAHISNAAISDFLQEIHNDSTPYKSIGGIYVYSFTFAFTSSFILVDEKCVPIAN